MANKRRETEWLPSVPELKKPLKEILVRLPANDLARYKLVHKDWRDFIKSPDFVSEHINRSNSDPSSHIILLQDRIPCREPVPFKYAARCLCDSALIVGSINGLLCVAGNYNNNLTTPDDVWLLNPITGNATKLPPPSSPMVLDNCDSVTFAFACDFSTVTGNIEYKVFKITSKSKYSHSEARIKILCSGNDFYKPIKSNTVEVWSSDSPNTWREVPMNFDKPFYHPVNWVSRSDAIVGGVAYWIVVDKHALNCFVLSLEIKSHKLNLISLPNISTPLHTLILNGNSSFFGTTWEDHFALILQEETVDDAHYYSVWKLDYNGLSWCEKFSFCLDYGIRRCFKSINSRIVLELDNGMVSFYNTTIGKLEALRNEGFFEFSKEEEMVNYDFDDAIVYSAHGFVGSLLSIAGFRRFEDFENCPYLVFISPSPGYATSSNHLYLCVNINVDDDDGGITQERDLSFLESFATPQLSFDVNL
ncbi:hypothetical protein CASFOL_031472 [Castilleja foliolosa]|uniref:F-box domain-containing protein n=1 Tax=Castilleja foliolosa TaxID=1961234 RepID=A0ABD3C664_9LAMI